MRTGRCFRDSRRTARRKNRQAAALVEFKRMRPGVQQAKQKLVEGYKNAIAGDSRRRAIRW